MIGPGDPIPDAADAGAGGPRVVDVSGLPARVADAVVALVEHHATTVSTITDATAAGTAAPAADAAAAAVAASAEPVVVGGDSAGEGYREHWGDVIQAAEAVKGFADACALDAAGALVTDVTAAHGIAADDPRYARKVAAHHKAACRAVVHEVQLLTGSTLTAARTRVRFATALPERVHGAHQLLRSGGCSWERARIAHTETAHLDPVLAGAVINRLLAPPERTTAPDGTTAGIPVSHSGFRARIRRQLALTESAADGAARRHRDAVDRRDAYTTPAPEGTAAFTATGEAARVFTAQQRIADLAKAAKAAGDPRTLAQLRADIALDLLIGGTIPGDQHLGDAPAGKLHVIVPLAAILPADLVPAGAALGLAEVPGLGFLTPDQLRQIAIQAGSTWARLVTDPVTGTVIDAANTYRAPAPMARRVHARDHTCRAPGDCAIPADQCDLDHDTEHQPGATSPSDGATHPDNLHTFHRGHHNVKTGRFWSSRQHADASISWHTLTRRLRTTPFNHHAPHDHAPPAVSEQEQKLALRLAAYCEHDLTPNVFTDLADLHLLTGHNNPENNPPTPPDIDIRHTPHGPRVILPDPKPPF